MLEIIPTKLTVVNYSNSVFKPVPVDLLLKASGGDFEMLLGL
jgi:hypothetical protein